MCERNLVMSNNLETQVNLIRLLISEYKSKVTKLKKEMYTLPASMAWGVKSGQVEVYEDVINDLKHILGETKINNDEIIIDGNKLCPPLTKQEVIDYLRGNGMGEEQIEDIFKIK